MSSIDNTIHHSSLSHQVDPRGSIVASGVVPSGGDVGIPLAAGARGSFSISFKVIIIVGC
jgi:hypothetical protein